MSTSQVNLDVALEYEAKFNPVEYVEHMISSSKDDGDEADDVEALLANKPLVRTLSNIYHELFSEHTPGDRLLDVGSGPSLWHVMSASGKYRSMTLSDPVSGNRRMLQQYMDDVKEDEKYTVHFKLTAKLEGDVSKYAQVKDRLRSSVKSVVWCDILQDHPLGDDNSDADSYDCVMSSLVMDAACLDEHSYVASVRRLVSLIRPGGKLVMGGTLGCTWYDIGGHRFRNLPLSEALICSAVVQAGCVVSKLLVAAPEKNRPSTCDDYKQLFGVAATKQ